MTLKLFTPRALSPWRDLDAMTNRLGGLFDEPWAVTPDAWNPAVNVEENDEAIFLTAELAGLTLDDITVEVEDNILRIAGEKVESREEGDEKSRFHLRERRYGAFTRAFTLPRVVDAEKIDARFEHGVLNIRMPKAAEARTKKIPVST